MAANVQNIDEFIMCVVGMGFSVEDAQEAVGVGKLSVEEAIEWILAGKPAPAGQAGSTLRLHPGRSGEVIGSNPFMNPQPHNPTTSEPTASLSMQDAEKEEKDKKVTSRMTMNEEQRKIKEHFEEKQREEARRKAKQEKLAQKKAHAKILMQIQEDRDDQKMKKIRAEQTKAHEKVLGQIHEDRDDKMKQIQAEQKKASDEGGGKSSQQAAASSSSDKSGGLESSTGTSSPPAKEARTDSSVSTPSPSKPTKCLLQIRLPGGKALRESFTPETLLREVRGFVARQMTLSDNMTFMQPFPRQEFSEAHMVQSLSELGLTPSGSLVVQKKSPPSTQASEAAADISGTFPAASAPAHAPVNRTGPAGNSPGAAANLPGLSGSLPIVPGGGGINITGPANVPVPPPIVPVPNLGMGVGPEGGGPAGAGHVWGAGHKLGDEEEGPDAEVNEEAMEEVPDEVEEPMDEGEDEDEDSDDDMPGQFPIFGQGPAGGGGNPNMGHQWGAGQALIGEVLNPQQLPHHNKSAKELAAEAANERFARYEPEPEPSGAAYVATPTSADIPSLVQLIIKNVTNRVCDTRQPITSFQRLPADVAMLILTHLIKERLLRPKTLQPFVSCYLRKLVLDNYPYNTNELLYAIRRHVYVTHLSLVGSPLITDKGLSWLTALKRLKYLNLSECRQITDTCIPTLKAFQNLLTLVLEDTDVTDAGVINYTQGAPPTLQRLTLNRTSVTEAIFQCLKVFRNLRSLDLEGTKISSLSGLDELTSLEHLNICGTRINIQSLACLSSLPKLVALNIALTLNQDGTSLNGDLALQYIQGLPLQLLELPDRHSTTDRGLQYIANMPLQTLDLTNYIHITNEATVFIGSLTSLTRLRISNTKITDAGMLQLRGLRNLRELYLDRLLVTEEGLAVLAEFHRLQELSLMATGISNAFLQNETLNKYCKFLTKLNLSRNTISNRGVSHLRLPQLTLLNLDATKVKDPIEVILRSNCPDLQKVMLSNLEPITQEDEGL